MHLRVPIYILLFISFYRSFGQQQNANRVSHYLLPEFVPGKVVMKNGTSRELMVNYEMLTSKMVILERGVTMVIGENDSHTIDSIYAGDHLFVLVNNRFLELLHDSSISLYVDHKSKIDLYSKKAAYGGRTDVGAVENQYYYNNGSGVWKLDDTGEFEKNISREYYLKTEDLLKFGTKNQFLKLFPEHERLLRKYIRKENIKFVSPKSIIKLTQYLEEIL